VEVRPADRSQRSAVGRGEGRIRLAILTTHPIQYYAPWFRHLATLFDLEVLYAYKQDAAGQGKAGFGVAFDWDIPLLEGYRYRSLENVSHNPGLDGFFGCDTPELYDLIRPRNYEVLLVLGWNKKTYIQGIRAAWRHRVPVLMRGDSVLKTKRSPLTRVLKFPFYRRLLPRIDGHLYVGSRNREYLRHYGVPEDRLFFSPHFVDNDFFASRSQAAKDSGRVLQIRDQFGIPPHAFVALFVGKFISAKRPLDFVLAAQSATEQRSDFHALLVGDGPLRSEAESAAKGCGAIHFAGFQNQSMLPDFYAAGDVLILPSEGETWGLVVNEAFASGIPAIVSDAVGSAPDLIDANLTGWTFPMGDVAALARLLIDFRGANRGAIRCKEELYSMSGATKGLQEAIAASLHHG
jgi:glycosyltransferase involved in cell wall biosynthesis